MTDPVNNQNEILNDVAGQFKADEEVGTRVVGVLPGNATLRVENVFVNWSKGVAQRKQLCMSCTVLVHSEGDEMIGREYVKKWGLETADNLKWLNGDLTNLELQPMQFVTVPELKRVMTALNGIVFDTALVENDNKQYPPNSWINPGARRKDLEGGSTGEKPKSRF